MKAKVKKLIESNEEFVLLFLSSHILSSHSFPFASRFSLLSVRLLLIPFIQLNDSHREQVQSFISSHSFCHHLLAPSVTYAIRSAFPPETGIRCSPACNLISPLSFTGLVVLRLPASLLLRSKAAVDE
jgi:hypothetical protein